MRALAPFTLIQLIISIPLLVQVQPTIPAPPTEILVVDLEESNDEQGLHTDVLDLSLNSLSNSEQPSSSTPILKDTPVAPEINEKPTYDPTEPPKVKQTTVV